MDAFIFIKSFEELDGTFTYNLGILKPNDKLSEIKEFGHLSSSEVREMLNKFTGLSVSIIGYKLRSITLRNLYHDLCRNKLDLPELLKIHWVPPYKVPIEDIDWLYNYGLFSDGDDNSSGILSSMAINLGFDKDPNEYSDIQLIADIYFRLIGDFDKLN